MKKNFKKAIKCNCRQCRGSTGSKPDNVVEEMQEKDIIAAKSPKIQDREASEKDNSDSDSDYEKDNRKSKNNPNGTQRNQQKTGKRQIR